MLFFILLSKPQITNNFSNIKSFQEFMKLRLLTITAKRMKFSIKDFFSKCDQIRRRLVTLTEEILNGKLHFLCSVTKNNAKLHSSVARNIQFHLQFRTA